MVALRKFFDFRIFLCIVRDKPNNYLKNPPCRVKFNGTTLE